MTITFEKLQKDVGPDKAREIWREICRLGGFGNVVPEHSGGLDISGLTAEAKEAVAGLIAKKEGKK